MLGATQPDEHALFVTLGDYSADAVRIERSKSHLRLIGGTELVQLVLEETGETFDALTTRRRGEATDQAR